MTTDELIDLYKTAIEELELCGMTDSFEYQTSKAILDLLETCATLYGLSVVLPAQNLQLKAELDDLAKLGVRN